MRPEERGVDLINPYFISLCDEIDREPLRFLYLSFRSILEARLHKRILIVTHPGVPQRGAVAALAEDGFRYFIFVNEEDARENPLIVRLRVAHELAHLYCGHVAEMEFLEANNLGDAAQPDSRYVQWRNLLEDEADAFAANMFFAQGRVVEREIVSDQLYKERVGNLTINKWEGDDGRVEENRDSFLNDSQHRKAIVGALREIGTIQPPVPTLCKALASLWPKNEENLGPAGESRRVVAEKIHRAYRELIPPTGEAGKSTKPPLDHCLSCPDSAPAEQFCFADNHGLF